MGNSANIQFNVIDKTGGTQDAQTDIVYVMGPTLLGPLNDPKDIIYTPKQFRATFGGYFSQLTSPNYTSLFPNYCMALLEAGVKLRVCRVDDYSDFGDRATFSSSNSAQSDYKWLSIEGAITSGITIGLTIGSSAVTVPFNTNEATTLADLKTAIQAVSGYTVTIVESSPSSHLYLWKVTKAGSLATVAVTVSNTHPGIVVLSGTSIITADGTTIGIIQTKNPGAANNHINVSLSYISGKENTHYTLTVTDTLTGIVETYEDMYHTNSLIAGWSASNLLTDCLKDINLKSNLITITGINENLFTPVPIPMLLDFNFIGAEDGSIYTESAYIGSVSGRTGAHAFDEYEDSFLLCIPDLEYAIATTGLFFDSMMNYCKNRKDLVYLQHIPTALSDTVGNTVYYIRAQTAGNGSDGALIGGGITAALQPSGDVVECSELPFVIANMIRSHKENGVWISATNQSNGIIPQAKSVIRNYGSIAVYEELNTIANAGGNMVINRGGSIMLWDDYTVLRESSQLQFLNVVLLMKFIKRSLRPTLERYLGKPNTFLTWERMYYANKPFLDKLVSKSALENYEWRGDQFAQKMTDLVINNADDVALGKYVIELELQPIPPLKSITVNIIVTKAGVTIQ